MMDMRLRTVLAVNSAMGYTAAAKMLNLSQPAVSFQIRSLESELGCQIFRKTPEGMKPTREGEIVIKYATRIESLHRHMERKLEDLKENKRSYVIGITHTSETNLIAEVFAEYCYRHPGTRIKIKSDSIRKLYERLGSLELDLAVTDGLLPSNKFSYMQLDTDLLVAIVGKDSPLANKKTISIEELRNERMVLRSSSSQTTSLLSNALAKLNLTLDDFQVMMEIDNVATIKDIVAKNVAVSILPRSACYGHSRDLAILPIVNISTVREVSLLFPKDFEDKEFLTEISRIYAEISRG